MRNTLKAATLESKFPLLAVEADCIISKDADITAVFEVELPELFTVTRNEYEAIHSAWAKAVKVLPNYSIVHRQDWFIEENYTPDIQRDDLSFLSRSFERHFNERPYLRLSMRHGQRLSRYCPIIRWYISRIGLSGRITAARQTRRI